MSSKKKAVKKENIFKRHNPPLHITLHFPVLVNVKKQNKKTASHVSGCLERSVGRQRSRD